MFDDNNKIFVLNVDGRNVSVEVDTRLLSGDKHRATILIDSVGDRENGILHSDSKSAAYLRANKMADAIRSALPGNYVGMYGAAQVADVREFATKAELDEYTTRLDATLTQMKASKTLNPKSDYAVDSVEIAKRELANANFRRIEDLETVDPSGQGATQRPGFTQAEISTSSTQEAQVIADSINELVLRHDIPGTNARVRRHNVYVDAKDQRALPALEKAIEQPLEVRQWDERALDNVPDERFLQEIRQERGFDSPAGNRPVGRRF